LQVGSINFSENKHSFYRRDA